MTSVQLPGFNNVLGMYSESIVSPQADRFLGLWPAVWTMGNLGRAGYGATLEGLWPYSYGMLMWPMMPVIPFSLSK